MAIVSSSGELELEILGGSGKETNNFFFSSSVQGL